ncbi:MAG: hypothetical protein ACJ76V_01955 [Thermoleophilaceae bacterium]
MDRTVAWKSLAAQLAAVALLGLALGLSLPHSFFEDWGWLAGPAAWALAALFTSRVVRLPWLPVLAGAALAGLPGVVAVVVGVHWAGAVVGAGVFALWCGWLAARLSTREHVQV